MQQRVQSHCQWCHRRFTAEHENLDQAMKQAAELATEHERGCAVRIAKEGKWK
jgi:hypothetical protein